MKNDEGCAVTCGEGRNGLKDTIFGSWSFAITKSCQWLRDEEDKETYEVYPARKW